jgi:H2-forming N5,N10-methylenetetrahydromethanopterin dehydrogenase-like enzyme
MTDGFCEQNNQTEATSRRTDAVSIPSLGGGEAPYGGETMTKFLAFADHAVVS